MKVRVLYGSVICITCILTVLIFLDFRKQWKTTEDFRIEKLPLSVRHLFIAPAQVKVENWQVGESSVYRLQTNRESKEISFSVAADAEGGNRFWLRTRGFLRFNEIDIELWRLLDNTNLRPGSEHRSFYFSQNAIPFPSTPIKFPASAVFIEKLGEEVVVTPMGPLECEHAFAYIRSPKGELEPILELWTHPAAVPLGLVRARWQDAFLDLVEVETTSVPEIPQLLLAEFDRNTPIDGSCTRCHPVGLVNKSLKLESIGWLSGEALNLTTALFHHRQASLFKLENLIHIQLTEKTWRMRRGTLAKFSWEQGNFWVKPDIEGKLRFFLDATAHQGNITVESSTGRLALYIGQ